MPKLEFLDFGNKRKKFKTDNFKIVKMPNGRFAAQTVAPSGTKAFRFVSADFVRKNK